MPVFVVVVVVLVAVVVLRPLWWFPHMHRPTGGGRAQEAGALQESQAHPAPPG